MFVYLKTDLHENPEERIRTDRYCRLVVNVDHSPQMTPDVFRTVSGPFVLLCTVNLYWITRSQHDEDLYAIINMSEQNSDSFKVKSLFQTNVAILLPKHWWACSRLMKLKLLIFKKLLLGYEMPEKNPFLPFYKFQTLFVSME